MKYTELLFHVQAVIDANIFPVLIDILGRADFKTRKEAAWAITNATSGGSPEQIKYVQSVTTLDKTHTTYPILGCSIKKE